MSLSGWLIPGKGGRTIVPDVPVVLPTAVPTQGAGGPQGVPRAPPVRSDDDVRSSLDPNAGPNRVSSGTLYVRKVLKSSRSVTALLADLGAVVHENAGGGACWNIAAARHLRLLGVDGFTGGAAGNSALSDIAGANTLRAGVCAYMESSLGRALYATFGEPITGPFSEYIERFRKPSTYFDNFEQMIARLAYPALPIFVYISRTW